MTDALTSTTGTQPGNEVITPCPLNAAAKTTNCTDIADARAKAVLANHTYGKDDTVPDGYKLLDPDTNEGLADLKKFGVTKDDLAPADSPFKAEIFEKDGPDGNEYVVAFRGTRPSELVDWKNNLQQGAGLESDMYNRAKALGEVVCQGAADIGAKVSFVGHSLGGGLASAAAVLTGSSATTYNAAGLNAHTVGGYPAIGPMVDAYYVPGEILSGLQDNRGAILGAIAVAMTGASPGAGAAVTAYIAGNEVGGTPVLPQAYGERHALPVAPPDGKSWLSLHNPIDKHGMDWVINGIDGQRREMGCV